MYGVWGNIHVLQRGTTFVTSCLYLLMDEAVPKLCEFLEQLFPSFQKLTSI